MNPYLIAGDFHFCSIKNDILKPFQALLNLAVSLDAKLFLNGDVFEFYYEQDGVLPDNILPLVDCLKNFVDKGLDITVLRGNRDFLMGRELARRTGCKVKIKDQLILEKDKIIITHGDQYVSNRSYRFWRVILRSSVLHLASKIVPTKFLHNLSVGIRNKSLKNREEETVYKKQVPKNVNVPEGYLMVMGHYHYLEEKIENGSGYVICPAFDESFQVLKFESGKYEFIKVYE